jgi:hypothetical protein
MWMHRYIPVEFTRQLFDENSPTPSRDVSLSGCMYLNSWHVLVPPVSREGRDEIRHCCFIMLPDLRDDLAFALESYKWATFGS